MRSELEVPSLSALSTPPMMDDASEEAARQRETSWRSD